MNKNQKKNGVFLMRGKGHNFEQFKAALMQRLEDEGFFEEEDKQPPSKPLKTTGTKTKKVRNTKIRSATEEDYRKRQNWSVGTFHTVSTLPTTEASSGEEKPSDKSEETLSMNNLATEEITMDKKQKTTGTKTKMSTLLLNNGGKMEVPEKLLAMLFQDQVARIRDKRPLLDLEQEAIRWMQRMKDTGDRKGRQTQITLKKYMNLIGIENWILTPEQQKSFMMSTERLLNKYGEDYMKQNQGRLRAELDMVLGPFQKKKEEPPITP